MELVDCLGLGTVFTAPVVPVPVDPAPTQLIIALLIGDKNVVAALLVIQDLLGHLHQWPCLILQSGSDETVPDASRSIPIMGQRMLAAIGHTAQLQLIAGAPHSCENFQDEVAAHVTKFITDKVTACVDNQQQ